MPKVKIDSTKGLVQQAGSGIVAASGLSLTPSTLQAPAAAAGGATNTISSDSTVVIVSNATNGDDAIYLPDPATSPAGKIYWLVATEAFELRVLGDTSKISGVAATNGGGAATKELAVSAGGVLMCIRQAADDWKVVVMANAGTADAV